MSRRHRARRTLLILLIAALLAALVVSCGAQSQPEPSGSLAAEEPAEEGEGTRIAPEEAPTAVTAPPLATAAAVEEIAEVEWPGSMRLGESDVVRLSLLPTEEGYEVHAEFAEHRTVTETVALEQLAGYDVIAAARLDGVGFNLAPEGDQAQDWQPNRPLTWRWTISPRRSGQQRLSLSLTMQWRPEAGRSLPSRQVTAFSRALDVQVAGGPALGAGQMLPLGIAVLGIAALALGMVLAAPLLRRWQQREPALRRAAPDRGLRLEPHPALALDEREQALLQAVFQGYSRAAVEEEFHSGYSEARTFLVLPIRQDGRADAYTIAKLGARASILREYENYETYVEHTLPPVTARIQGRPVTLNGRGRSAGAHGAQALAALRYTFIGAPGQQPRSLRQELLENGSVTHLETLFRTFGPNWWMQRRPYAFRLAAEYDCKLPVHAVVAPDAQGGATLDGQTSPAALALAPGDRVTLRGFKVAGGRQNGPAVSLIGEAQAGQPALRVRWLGPAPPDGANGRVVATRETLLQKWCSAFKKPGVTDPLPLLPAILAQTISGSRSIIHGDLNVENALVGPGDIVWLIDFASTREGHTLFDFAHLGAELVAHVMPARYASSEVYLTALTAREEPLLEKVVEIAARCLADAQQGDEFRLAFGVSCLGALKHGNLDERAREFLYVTGAYLLTGRD